MTIDITPASSSAPTSNPLAPLEGVLKIPKDVLKSIYNLLDNISKDKFERTCKTFRVVGVSVRKGVPIYSSREDFLNTLLEIALYLFI